MTRYLIDRLSIRSDPLCFFSSEIIIKIGDIRGGKKMQDILNVAVVNFNPVWGEKEKNLSRIKGYISCAAKRGADMIVLPEMSLTGYDSKAEESKENKMQIRLAETLEGETVSEIKQLAEKHHIYVAMGMPERDLICLDKIYNTLMFFSPEGSVHNYRKIHLALNEPEWAEAGENPVLVDTPWGPVGLSICYDVYSFPELIRYYAAKGARLIINSTAYARSRGAFKGKVTLESTAVVNGIYIATANLCGQDAINYFWGGSSIIGPSRRIQEVHYYAGMPFDAEGADKQEMYMAAIDLSLAFRGLFEENKSLGRADFRPDLYAKWYKELI